MAELELQLLSSLDKVFWDGCDCPHLVEEDVMLENEQYAFQAAFCYRDEKNPSRVFGSCALEGMEGELRQVESVPSRLAAVPEQLDAIRREPGWYPDVLADGEQIRVLPGQWGSVWVTIPGGAPGERTVSVTLTVGETSQTARLRLRVLPERLPAQKLIFTQWLHWDCIARQHRTEMFSERFWELLEADVGDAITLDGDKRVEAVVADIVENYAYHYVYLSEACYQALFGTAPEDNVILLAYREDTSAAQSDAVSAELMALDAVTSYSYIATLRDSFTNSMVAIDYAVVIIITAAAALAFVVLYNLTNINITERTRELATLKVLGFFDKETTAYVYRENVFLTIFGIVLGLVLGRLLHAWLVLTVEVDLVMFGRTAPPYAYVLAAALTVAFSVMVNIAAHFKLKKVDMVESLKTVE